MDTDLPLSDLHRHLDGSLRLSTVEELAGDLGVTIPDPLRFTPAMGLQEALDRFDFTLSLLSRPSAVRRVAHEMCLDAEAEGVTTLEIRFAPQLHEGGSIEENVDAAIEGIDGRAGLILCGLYGEPPEVLGRLVGVAARRPEVTGIDLAGGPTPAHQWRMEDYAPVFAHAADIGLGRTVHAGEGRPPAEIAVAIDELKAQRIGHGTTILDDPRIVELAIERGVTLEACITSNFQVGAIESPESHPLPRWLDAGLRACLCADNTLFSGVTVRDEVELASRLPGMDRARIAQVIDAGHQAAFRR